MPRISPLLAAAVALSLGSVARAAAILNTPTTLTTCQPAALAWSGASGSVYISAVTGTDTSAAAVKIFPTQSGASGSYTWTVDVAEGTTLTFIINDDTGVQNFTGQVTVRAGTSDSCVDDDVSVSGTASGSSTTPAASSSGARTTTTGTSTSTTIGSGTSTFSTSGSTTKTSAAASSTTTASTSAATASTTSAPANGAWASRGAPSVAALCAAVLAAFAL